MPSVANLSSLFNVVPLHSDCLLLSSLNWSSLIAEDIFLTLAPIHSSATVGIILCLVADCCIVFSACNCSALAVSDECDQVTGACVCQDEAQGLKCDDCEYGYIGIIVLELKFFHKLMMQIWYRSSTCL